MHIPSYLCAGIAICIYNKYIGVRGYPYGIFDPWVRWRSGSGLAGKFFSARRRRRRRRPLAWGRVSGFYKSLFSGGEQEPSKINQKSSKNEKEVCLLFVGAINYFGQEIENSLCKKCSNPDFFETQLFRGSPHVHFWSGVLI